MSVLAVHAAFTRDDEDRLGFRYRRLWARRSTRLLGIQVVEQLGVDYSGTALYVSNHRTLTDPIVQAGYFDSYIIAKNDVGSIPIIGKGAEMTGIILVDRGQMSSRLAARTQTKELLATERSILVYAEGTTTTDRHTSAFKIGTFKAAVEAGVPVVPLAIEYRDKKDYWLEESMMKQMVNQIGQGKTYVKVRIGEPIHSDQPDELMTLTKQWIDKNLLEMQTDWSQVFD